LKREHHNVPRQLDLADIQGGILRDYGEHFPKGRFIFLRIGDDAAAARQFIDEVRGWITTAVRWDSKAVNYPGEVRATRPPVTLNMGFTFEGLRRLGVPIRTLQELPAEYIEGMRSRSNVLGDTELNGHEQWDHIWKPDTPDAHIAIMMRAQVVQGPSFDAVPELDHVTQQLFALVERHRLTVLEGHKGPNGRWQDASTNFKLEDGRAKPIPVEHFGFTDAISEVVFDEQGADLRVEGGGKISRDGEWQPHAIGEFLLGHPDESQEVPPAAFPSALMRNGTFLAYRKLHQNVKAFKDYVAASAETFAQVYGGSTVDAQDTIKAKIIGRWTNGVPLMAAATPAERDKFLQDYVAAVQAAQVWKKNADRTKDPANPDEREAQYQAKLADARRPFIGFRYKDDPEGVKCPVGAHIRRVNTRDMLDVVTHSSILNNRRRILRRGLPYGAFSLDTSDDNGEHGVIFLGYCANLFRQFEFVQQQWLQYGLDFNAGNDRCPLLGNRVKGESHKFVIPSDPDSGKPPFICSNLPQFVQTRGGEYFFVPSLTGLRMIAMGTVDPT
jgi:Dyp-type peroxidase family